MLERHDEAPVAMRRQGKHAGHVRHQAERHPPLLRLVEQFVGGAFRQRLLEDRAQLLKPFVWVDPGQRLVARVFGDVLAAEKLAQHVPLRPGQGIESDVAVRRRQHVAGAGTGADARVAFGREAPVFVEHRRNLGAGQHRLLHAGVYVVSAPMPGAADDGELGGGGGIGAGQRLGEVATHLQRLALRHAAQMAPAADCAGNQVRRLVVRLRPKRAKAGNRGEKSRPGFHRRSVS